LTKTASRARPNEKFGAARSAKGEIASAPAGEECPAERESAGSMDGMKQFRAPAEINTVTNQS
jgi:hypothetical protein